MSTKKSTKKQYTATIFIGPRKYSATGTSVRDALDNLEIGQMAAEKVVVQLKKGKTVQERVFPPFISNRMFKAPPQVQEMTKKNIAHLFDI